MKQVEGRIIIKFKDNPTPLNVLEVEQYLNDTIANMVYANKRAAIRVHLESPTEEAIKAVWGDMYDDNGK